MDREWYDSLSGIRPQRRRRGGMSLEGGLPPPDVRIHPDRGTEANLRKVCELADDHGSVMVYGYGRSEKRALYKVRHRLPDGYKASINQADPERNPDRYRRQQYRMLVTRIGGPDPTPRVRPLEPPYWLLPQPPDDE